MLRRLLIVLAVAGVGAAVVAGCTFSSSPPSPPPSSSTPPPPPPSSNQAARPLPDPAALLKQSSATTKNLKSAHLLLLVAGKVAAMPVRTLEADLTNEPRNEAKGSAIITIMGAEVVVEFVVFHRRLYIALPGGDWRDYGFASQVYDVTATLNPDTGLANMLTNFIDPKVEARETIGDQETVRVAGNITSDAMNELVPQMDATKRIPCTVWIQERGDHQLVRAELTPGKGESIQMTLSKWNESVTVDKPRQK